MEEKLIEMLSLQAKVIMSEDENKNWIDSPEKLLVATIYRLVNDGKLNGELIDHVVSLGYFE